MKRTIRYSRAADRDFKMIGQQSLSLWGRNQTRKYLHDIHNVILGLVDYPDRGPQYSGLQDGIRKIGSGSHLIFYRLEGTTVIIVRILHARMDVPSRIVE
jgi:toxin ParE1/3/4